MKRSRVLVLTLACVLASAVVSACANGDPGAVDETMTEAEAGPPVVPPEIGALHPEGAAAVESQGCLGCHMIGGSGNRIGPDLTEVGRRLGPAEIAEVLRRPDGIMPSYSDLDAERFRAVVDFLSLLGASSPAATPA